MLSRRGLSCLSTQVESSSGESVVERAASEMIGIAATSNFWITGSWIAAGRSPRTALILARASCTASLTRTSSWNCAITNETPSSEVEVTCLTPAIGLTASSMRLETSRSTVSGEAPG